MLQAIASAQFVPAGTSAAIERLEDAGVVIFATTTTPEFCYFGYTASLERRLDLDVGLADPAAADLV